MFVAPFIFGSFGRGHDHLRSVGEHRPTTLTCNFTSVQGSLICQNPTEFHFGRSVPFLALNLSFSIFKPSWQAGNPSSPSPSVGLQAPSATIPRIRSPLLPIGHSVPFLALSFIVGARHV